MCKNNRRIYRNFFRLVFRKSSSFLYVVTSINFLWTEDLQGIFFIVVATKAVAAAMERDPGSGNGIDILVIPNLLIVKNTKEVTR